MYIHQKVSVENFYETLTKHFYTYIEESIGFVQIFVFRFLMDLQVLGCFEHDFIITRKCLSVRLPLCM